MLTALLIALFALPALAQNGGGTDINGIRAEIDGIVADAERKYIALAKAMPNDKYNWRPDKGVRSVAEVFTHIVTANYFISTLAGATPPEGYRDRESLGKIGKMTEKDKIVPELEKSFAYVRKVIAETDDSKLDNPANFFGTKTTVRGILNIISTHAHQHLGQSIAYARMNKVTPPWSQANDGGGN